MSDKLKKIEELIRDVHSNSDDSIEIEVYRLYRIIGEILEILKEQYER